MGVAHDDLRKEMIIQAAPPGVKAHVVPIDKMIQVAKDPRFGNTKALVLFENPQDALRAIEGGVVIKTLNLGSMAHSQGKVVCTKAVSMGQDDVVLLKSLWLRVLSLMYVKYQMIHLITSMQSLTKLKKDCLNKGGNNLCQQFQLC